MMHDDADDYAGLPAASQFSGASVTRAGATYTVIRIDHSGALAIHCKFCGRVSHNVNDVVNLYCGFCHRFHEGVS
jgi:hypothetical protein